MSSSVGVVIPGTNIIPIIEKILSEQASRRGDDQLPVIKLGVGLIQSGERIVAVKPGLLHFTKPNRFWIEGRQRRVPFLSKAFSPYIVYPHSK